MSKTNLTETFLSLPASFTEAGASPAAIIRRTAWLVLSWMKVCMEKLLYLDFPSDLGDISETLQPFG